MTKREQALIHLLTRQRANRKSVKARSNVTESSNVFVVPTMKENAYVLRPFFEQSNVSECHRSHLPATINIDETSLKIISQFAVSITPCLQFAPSHVHLHPDNVLIFSTVQTVSGDHLSISWVVSHWN